MDWTGGDPHKGETILDECPHCHLPIYASDVRRLLAIPPGSGPTLFHGSCARSAEGYFWEQDVTAGVAKLRACGYQVDLKLTRPVR